MPVVCPRTAPRSRRRRTRCDHLPRLGGRRRRPAVTACRGACCTTTPARMAAALQARGVGPPAHTSRSSGRPRGRSSPRSRRRGCAGRRRSCSRSRCGSARSTSSSRRRGPASSSSDASLVVVDPQLAEFLDPVAGDPPIVLLDELVAERRADGAFDAPGRRPRTSRDPPVHERLDLRSAGRDAPAPVRHRERRRDRGSCRPRRRRRPWRFLAAAVPRHGPDRVADDPDDDGHGPRARRAAGLPRRAGAVDAVVLGLRRDRERGTELRLRARGPGACAASPASTSRRGGSRSTAPSRSIPTPSSSFVAAGAPHGLRASAVFPAFGMAEATLAVTFPEPGSRPHRRRRSTAGCSRPRSTPRAVGRDTRRRAPGPTRPSGTPGSRCGCANPRPRSVMRDREVGEIEIRGASVTPGYYGRPDATAAAFHDGWLRTGDLGYLVDGELVVCGRIKDVIILGGRNVHPQDVERAIADVDGVRAGNVIAFGTAGRRGREVARRRRRSARRRRPTGRSCGVTVAARVRDVVGMPAEEVVLVRPGHAAEDVVGQAAAHAVPRALPRRAARTDQLTRRLPRGSHHRPGVAVVAVVGARGAAGPQQPLDAALHRVELEPVEERAQPGVERPRCRSVGETLQVVAHARRASGSPAKSQITVRSFHCAWNVRPWSMPKIASSAWSRRQWPPLRSVLLTRRRTRRTARKSSPCVVEQREVVLVGIVLDEPLHRADAGGPSRRTVSGTMSQPSASESSYAATSRWHSVPWGKSQSGRSPRCGL